MGQSDIIEILKKKKVPMAAREISEEIEERINEVITNLNKLLKFKEVKCIEIDRYKALKHFNCKRKMRLYYISNLDKSDLQKAKSTLPYL